MVQVACPKLTVDRSELERGFTYIEGGFDWDNSTWACLDGALQSPINFPSFQCKLKATIGLLRLAHVNICI